MNNKTIVSVVVVAALVLVGGYFLYHNSASAPASLSTDQESDATSAGDQTNVDANATQAPAGKTYEVTYTDAGYSPQTLTIKVGDTVTWKNQSTHNVWTASGMHPSHTDYAGTTVQQHCPDPSNTSFDECAAEAPGTSWSFTFTKAGTWPYHNHVKASDFGKVIVEQ